MNNETDNGVFRRKAHFTQVQNSVAQNIELSLRARGLYLLIQSYITLPNGSFTKEFFMKKTKVDGKKAFDSGWRELKQNGFLVMHRFRTEKGFRNEYELLDEPQTGAHTIFYDSDGNVTKKLYLDTNDLTDAYDAHLCDTQKGDVTEGDITKVPDNNNTNDINTIKNNTKNHNTSNNFELLEEVGCPDNIRPLLDRWIQYRNDAGEVFTKTGMEALVEMIKKAVAQTGYNHVSDVVEHAVASGYKGIPLSNLNRCSTEKTKTAFHQFDMRHDYNYAEMEQELLKH